MNRLYYKSTCSTCRKARVLLDELGIEREERDMSKAPLSEAEVDALLGERDWIPFLNTRTDEYRERQMKANPPSREETVWRMAANANLIRRPLMFHDDAVIYGFDEAAYRRLAEA